MPAQYTHIQRYEDSPLTHPHSFLLRQLPSIIHQSLQVAAVLDAHTVLPQAFHGRSVFGASDGVELEWGRGEET